MPLNRIQGKQSKALKIAEKFLRSQNINQLEQKLELNGSFLIYGDKLIIQMILMEFFVTLKSWETRLKESSSDYIY